MKKLSILQFVTLVLLPGFMVADLRAGTDAYTAESIAREAQEYILTPETEAVYPTAVYEASAGVEDAANLLAEDGQAAVLRYKAGGAKPYVILDMGRASASGYPVFKVKSRKGTPVVRLAYSTYPAACGEEGGFKRGDLTYLGKEVDLPVLPAHPGRYELYTIPRNGTFIAPLIQGQQRYVRVQLDTPDTEVAIDSLHILNKEVHDLSPTVGHFLSNNETINKIWYASTWTLQIASFPHHNAWQALHGWLAPRKLEKANEVALAKAGAGWSDYRFAFDFEIRTNPYDLSHAGWAFRAKDPNNGYVAAIDLDGKFTLQKRVAGEYESLKEIDLNPEILDGERYHIEVELKGDTITTFLNGKQIDLTRDDTYASGRIGFWHPKEKWFLIDNVKLSDLKGKQLLADDFSGELEQWDYARTLGFIADGAKRDRLVWSGDLWWAQRNVFYAFDHARYLRESLKMLAFNQTPEGYIHAAPYPENRIPPGSKDYGHWAHDSFSTWFVPVAWDYLLYSGDLATLRELYPVIAKNLHYHISSIKPDGLIHENVGRSKNGTYMNVLMWYALEGGAQIAAELGEASDAAEFQAQADALESAINNALWDEERGIFKFSLRDWDNALVLATGFATPEQAARIIPQCERISHGKMQNILIRGMMRYGYGNAGIDAFFAHGWPTLVNTPEVPLTVTESMDIKRGGWGDESHPDTAVGYIFTSHLLGVEPTELAYTRYSVKPVMSSLVDQAKGVVPTPHGDIVTAWKREDTKFEHHLVSPEGTLATIALPVEGLKAYELQVNGQRAEDGIQGVDRIDFDGRYLYLHDVDPGRYHSVLTVQEGSYNAAIEAQIVSRLLRKSADVQTSSEIKWGVRAPNTRLDGPWALKTLVDGVTSSHYDTKGYTSLSSNHPDQATWLEIDLKGQKSVKTITLYPRTDAKAANGLTPGFPVDMKVLIQSPGEDWTTAKTLTGIPNPEGKPYEIDMYTILGYPKVEKVRFEVSKRGLPAADEPDAYRLQLAEIDMSFDE